MVETNTEAPPVSCVNLTPDRWDDLEALFGPRGACGGCWCMWWRLPRSQFQQGKGDINRRAFEVLVREESALGVLAYQDGSPVGWCAVGPRESFPVLQRSRVLRPVDEEPVWSVVCFFVPRKHRRMGVATSLLAAAKVYAMTRGASIVEGYPVEPRADEVPDAFAWTGVPSIFRKAGFVEVARRSPTRPIMRHFTVKPGAAGED